MQEWLLQMIQLNQAMRWLFSRDSLLNCPVVTVTSELQPLESHFATKNLNEVEIKSGPIGVRNGWRRPSRDSVPQLQSVAVFD